MTVNEALTMTCDSNFLSKVYDFEKGRIVRRQLTITKRINPELKTSAS